MNKSDIKNLAPGLDLRVKVKKESYLNGGYVGTIASIGKNQLMIELQSGGICWELIEDCTLLVTTEGNVHGDDNFATDEHLQL